MRFGWIRKYPFLASIAQLLVPVLMMLLAVVLGAVLIFAFEYFLENLINGLRLVAFHFRRRRIAKNTEYCNARLRRNEAWLRKEEVVAKERAKIELEKIASAQKKVEAKEERKQASARRAHEKQAESERRKTERHDRWYVDPRKVKSNGSAARTTVTVVAGLALAAGGITGCVKSEVRSNVNPNRTHLELRVIPDFSTSQDDEKEANKAMLVSIAENLGPGDHLRIIPIDMASEGRNETLVDDTIPVAPGAMDFDLLSARNSARDQAEEIFELYRHRQSLTGGTSIIGALNTPAILDSAYNRCRRFIIIISDLEEHSWEVDLYASFDTNTLIDSLAAASRIPDLSDREMWVAGSTDAHVGPQKQQQIKKFWTLFAQKAHCKTFRWFGYDRSLLMTELSKIQKEGQSQEAL